LYSRLKSSASASPKTTEIWTNVYKDAKHLLMNLLDIEGPIAAAVNGPALVHTEIPVLSDIVIAAENADSAPISATGRSL
jgi:enoyl-CoA hydratase/carnithine racemase